MPEAKPHQLAETMAMGTRQAEALPSVAAAEEQTPIGCQRQVQDVRTFSGVRHTCLVLGLAPTPLCQIAYHARLV